MPEPEHLKGKSKKFGSGQDPTKGGRPKKIYTVLKELGYSKDDVRTAFGELLFYNMDELKEVVEKKDTPAIVLVVATAIRQAIKKGDYHKVKEIIDQYVGKSKESVDHTTNGKDVDNTIIIERYKKNEK